MADQPQLADDGLPRRVLFRSGTKSQIAASALRLGEGALTTDNWWGWLGDESQNPPHWPTSKTVGDFDWTNLNPFYNNINVNTINGKTIKELININIATGDSPVLLVVKEYLTKTVYGSGADFATLEDALAWLSQRTISSQGYITLVLASQQILIDHQIGFTHPNGDRITIRGGALKKSLPSDRSLQVTGSSATNIANDKTVNLAAIRDCFSTELTFTNGGCIIFYKGINTIQDILFSGDRSIAANQFQTNGVTMFNGSYNIKRCAAVNFQGGGFVAPNQSTLTLTDSVIAFGNGYFGIGCSSGSLIFMNISTSVFASGNGDLYTVGNGAAGINISQSCVFYANAPIGSNYTGSITASGNNGSGLIAQTSCGVSIGSTIATYLNNNSVVGLNIGFHTVAAVANGQFFNNGTYGVLAQAATAYLGGSIANSQYGTYAYELSIINRAGATISNCSVSSTPAVGTTGNNLATTV